MRCMTIAAATTLLSAFLVTVAMEIFNEHMPQPNQLSFVPDCSVTAQDLLRTPDKGQIT